ncbi:DUF131 domain-containing protein [Candidatus Bathyarchaeota archaeon A05DMB-2]|jgi:uncharacterized membrane protein|nr:DUF131 domain-containing protein [Candidatus Bathyarchaeota archaeon A05DMB-2]
MTYAGEGSDETAAEEGVTVSSRLLLFLILGFAMVFIGVLLIVVASVLSGGAGAASFGAVIFIGPFPIVVGAGPDMTFLIVVSAVLAVLSILVLLIMRRRLGRHDF